MLFALELLGLFKVASWSDFRSVVNTSGNFSTGARINEIPQNTDVVNADISYYLGKAARIVIYTESKITIV